MSPARFWTITGWDSVRNCLLGGHIFLISPYGPALLSTLQFFRSRGTWVCIADLDNFYCFAESFAATWKRASFFIVLFSSASLASGVCLSEAPGRHCVTWWLCCMCICPQLSPVKSLGYVCGRELILFSFSFPFPAACHRSDSHPASSALASFLQTGTTNSPVREQSERKMKNNIRKEPFGKLNKKCYIKINTEAWPFLVLYILKPPIDSLLITCLFYFTDTSLGRLERGKIIFFIMVVI